MKFLFAFAVVLMALPLCAQTEAPAAPAPPTGMGHSWGDQTVIPQGMLDHNPMFSTLSAGDKSQLGSAYTKAMTDSPDLLKEQTDLFQQAHDLHHNGNATDADKSAMREAFKAHFEKVRAAIIAADPTIEPVLMRIDQQLAKMKADWQAANPGATSGGPGMWGH